MKKALMGITLGLLVFTGGFIIATGVTSVSANETPEVFETITLRETTYEVVLRQWLEGDENSCDTYCNAMERTFVMVDRAHSDKADNTTTSREIMTHQIAYVDGELVGDIITTIERARVEESSGDIDFMINTYINQNYDFLSQVEISDYSWIIDPA